jgi:hypothetical protein
MAAVLMFSIAFLSYATPVSASNGMIQISGTGYYDVDNCPENTNYYDLALRLDGDLVGCQYITVEEASCTPSGVYNEVGTEYYIITGGTFGEGTFMTSYRFTGKFDVCPMPGSYPTEIFGRCQHPLIPGSGAGVFEDATGRLDFKDDVTVGNAPYRGHLRLPNWGGFGASYNMNSSAISQSASGGCG